MGVSVSDLKYDESIDEAEVLSNIRESLSKLAAAPLAPLADAATKTIADAFERSLIPALQLPSFAAILEKLPTTFELLRPALETADWVGPPVRIVSPTRVDERAEPELATSPRVAVPQEVVQDDPPVDVQQQQVTVMIQIVAYDSAAMSGELRLLTSRPEADRALRDRIDLGRELLAEPIHADVDYRRVTGDYRSWDDYNATLLRRLFADPSVAEGYERRVAVGRGPAPLQKMVEGLHRDIDYRLRDLVSLRGQLELYTPADEPAVEAPVTRTHGNAVFIVHGHSRREHEVARTVTELGLEPVILQERLHGGATLIEKLEREAHGCGYAIIVYTGDDEGRLLDSGDDLTPRARENVVLELGYFVGLLGREHVTILQCADVAVPSDFQGVGYYVLDDAGAWKAKVRGELERAGLL